MSDGAADHPPPDSRPRSTGASATHEETDHEAEPTSPFPHPPWTVNLVLVGGVITLLFGLLVSPLWLLVGSPFLVVLLLWLYVRLFACR